jgi:hypothetical protein
VTHENTRFYIDAYDGCSDVALYIFPTKYPLLPVRRDDGRVIFPYGNIRGYYTHVEIRKALELGAVLKRVYKTHYFLKNCRPFVEYVDFLYEKKKIYRKDNNKMEIVAKLLLTNLYGKFGEKFKGKENWIHTSMLDVDDYNNSNKEITDKKGNYIKITEDMKPASHCIPIWASYVTAYGRLKLYDMIVKHNPVYVDTDSLMTKDTIRESTELGELKLEMKIKEGYIVRPKFYALQSYQDDKYIKIKGLGKRISYMRFMGLIDDSLIEYDKICTFKEALRRGFVPNQTIETHKDLSLEDEKRVWQKQYYDPDMLQDSRAIDMDEVIDDAAQRTIPKHERPIYNGENELYKEDERV